MSEVSFYPPPPTPGSNSFGEFTFGVSAFGDYPPFSWLLTIISQYANSPTMLSMLESWNNALDQTLDYDNFFDFIWNVYTAQGIGLDIWGLIVGVNRNLQVSTGNWFGFQQGQPGTDVYGPGGLSPFYVGGAVTSNFALTDQAYRQLILAKAAANICDGAIPSINKILIALFGNSGPAYVTDGLNMTMTFTFAFQPTPVQLSIIYNSGVLPIPAGVAASIVISP